jgi:hypothetical protein
MSGGDSVVRGLRQGVEVRRARLHEALQVRPGPRGKKEALFKVTAA